MCKVSDMLSEQSARQHSASLTLQKVCGGRHSAGVPNKSAGRVASDTGWTVQGAQHAGRTAAGGTPTSEEKKSSCAREDL